MRALIDPFITRSDAVAEADHARVAHAVSSGVNVSIVGAALRALVFVAIIAYLLRFAVAPIRRIAGATERIAGGDLDVKVPETRPGRDRSARAVVQQDGGVARSPTARPGESERGSRTARERAARGARLDGRRDPALRLRRQRAAREQAGAQPDARARDDLRGPRRRPAALRRAPDQGPRPVPRRDGAASLESRRRDVRRVRGRGERPSVPGLHGARARRSRRVPRPHLDPARGDAAARARPVEGRLRRHGLARAPHAADLDDGLPRDDPGGRSGPAHRRAEALPRDRLSQLGAAAETGRRPPLRGAPRCEWPAAALRPGARRRDRARGRRVVVGARPLPRDRSSSSK